MSDQAIDHAGEQKIDLIVIGAGPGGYVAAVRASQLGLNVVCVDRRQRPGGVCLNEGCIPSKALLDSSEYFHLARAHFHEHGIKLGNVELDLERMMARKTEVVKDLTDGVRHLLQSHKIRLVHGTAQLLAPGRVAVDAEAGGASAEILEAPAILLATGSEPLKVPGLPFDGTRIVDSTAALSFETVPEHLGVVGGGYIGLELGSVWARLGAKVSVIEMLPKIATTLDGQVGRTLERILRSQGMEFHLNTRVAAAEVKGDRVETQLEAKGETRTQSFDRLLVAVGRRPLTRGLGLEALGVATDARTGQILVDETYQTNVAGLYAIGDLVPGPMLAHKASAEGIAAAESIAGRPGEVNYDAIPAVVYTWPEVASVGLTEEQAKARNIPCCIGTYPFSGTGRARCMGEKEGFAKLVVHSQTDRILGAHIIGPRASDMIAECVLALEFGASSEDIARTVHGHPTFAEALMEAAMGARKCSIYAS